MQTYYLDIGLQIFVREWPGEKTPYLLLHGLSSNALTWQAVADQLHAAGHRVIAIDQRGHGRSEKPRSGYDFDTITADVAAVIDKLDLNRPILVGQSWGGNVVLAFAANYPGKVRGCVFVDGGTIDFQARQEASWERVSSELRPPDLSGTPRTVLKEMIQTMNPGWSESGVEATLGNFETLTDGTIRPWLSLDRHMTILRALWDQRPAHFYPLVQEPVLLVMAEADRAERKAHKAQEVAAAEALLPKSRVYWLADTAHDIHVHRPDALVILMQEAAVSLF